MKEILLYETFDGEKFEDKDQAIAHEQNKTLEYVKKSPDLQKLMLELCDYGDDWMDDNGTSVGEREAFLRLIQLALSRTKQ